jgi:hypothetical protein
MGLKIVTGRKKLYETSEQKKKTSPVLDEKSPNTSR